MQKLDIPFTAASVHKVRSRGKPARGEVGWRSAGLQQHSVCGYSAAGVQRGSCHSHFRAVEHIKPIIITWSTAH